MHVPPGSSELADLALSVLKTSSAQVRDAVGRGGNVPGFGGLWLVFSPRPRLLRDHDRLCFCDWLTQRDERVRVTAAAAGERPGQGRGDPGAAAPDHGPGAAAGHDPAMVLP